MRFLIYLHYIVTVIVDGHAHSVPEVHPQTELQPSSALLLQTPMQMTCFAEKTEFVHCVSFMSYSEV